MHREYSNSFSWGFSDGSSDQSQEGEWHAQMEYAVADIPSCSSLGCGLLDEEILADFDLEPTPIGPGAVVRTDVQLEAHRLQHPQAAIVAPPPNQKQLPFLQELSCTTTLQASRFGQVTTWTNQQTANTSAASHQHFLSTHLQQQLCQSSVARTPAGGFNWAQQPQPPLADQQQMENHLTSVIPAIHSVQLGKKKPDGRLYTLANLDNDIVCARGRRFYLAPGNIRFRQVRDAFIPEYRAALTRDDRALVISRVIQAILMQNPSHQPTRFLKYHGRNQKFSIMTLTEIRDKVGHALRTSLHEESERVAETASDDAGDAASTDPDHKWSNS